MYKYTINAKVRRAPIRKIVYSTIMPYYVYIAECADKTLYTGITTDIVRREQQHNGERRGGAIYTASKRPVHIVYSEQYDTRSEALKREYDIKQLTKKQKMLMVTS